MDQQAMQCCNLCSFNETLAREIITETGEWKQGIVRAGDRKGKPMIVTRHGCCGCELTLEQGKSHPDWTYQLRHLTTEENRTFHEEYGKVAPLLIGMSMSDGFQIRGFILNGREEGWNLSVRKIEQ